MLSIRFVIIMVGAVLILASTAGVASAAKPTRPAPAASAPPTERPLTAEEQDAAARKLAAAEAYAAAAASDGLDLVTLSCVSPTSVGSDATIQACATPQGFLAVEARDQTKSFYCGPAVGQVITNYSWAVKSGTNKYTQAKLAGWMKTDINGYTNAPEMEDGLEAGTAGSPRRPAGWDWVVAAFGDFDGDGQFGDHLHAMVRSNVSNSKMPLAIPVKPHDSNDAFHLTSWPRAVSSPGHWISAYGWVGSWTGTDYSRMYYTDSSRDEGGSTGKYWDPMRHIAGMIMDHTRRLVW